MLCRASQTASLSAAIVGVLAAMAPALAQNVVQKAAPPARDGAPVIRSVFPPGATIGKSTELKFTGTNLGKIERWIVSGAGFVVGDVKAEGTGTLTAVVHVADDAEPGFRELRGAGPEGISNLVLFRVDTLPQSVEAEPNDVPEKANTISTASAVAGVLKAMDVDYYRVEARAGQRVVVDMEARRLGTSLSPVVTVLTASGSALAQGREQEGAEHDARFAFVFPADGTYLIEVRDNAYNGGESAGYRLRLDEARFATGLFPLGGPKGQTITVTASGGDLPAPLTKTVTLPDTPGTTQDVGLFDGPGGTVLSPGKLYVGEGPEITESSDGQTPLPLPLGTTANGRIDRPGEVDRYTLAVKKGEPIHVRIQAAPLGSWLDSVVALRDEKGNLLAENDDPGNNNAPRRAGIIFGIAEATTDSRLDYEPKADGEIMLEVTDRFGAGGPEYAYRLDVAATKPDFSITILLVNPNVNQGRVPVPAVGPATPGSTGAFNLRPGSRLPVNFLITPEGLDGFVEVSAAGLPEGVTATTVTVKLSAKGSQPVGGSIELKAAPDAEPSVGELRLVATGTGKNDAVTRTASALIAFEPVVTNNRQQFGVRPLTRIVSSLPVAITRGSQLASKPKIMGPPRPVALRVDDIKSPGPLLQGGRIELALVFDPAQPDADSFQLEAVVKGKGLVAQTIIADEESSTGGEDNAGTIVRVLASVDAEVGSKKLTISFKPIGGKAAVKEVPIEVLAPVSLTVPTEPVKLEPGGTASFRVAVKRAQGFASPVDLKLEDLPKGVKAVEKLRIARDQDGLDVRLEMDKETEPLKEPVAFRVVCLARMPRGPVRVDSAKRPMLCSHLAEK